MQRGLSTGVLTCHVGLMVPQGRVHMLVGPEMVRWSEGRALIFDDIWPHEASNHSESVLILLQMQFERPLLQPGKQIARWFLRGLRRFMPVLDPHEVVG